MAPTVNKNIQLRLELEQTYNFERVIYNITLKPQVI